MRRDSEGMRFGFIRGQNRGDTGMYTLTTAFPHPHRLFNEIRLEAETEGLILRAELRARRRRRII